MKLSEEIKLGESFDLEFKRIPNEDRVKYHKTAVAFANGRGGRIVFGVGNNREVIGIDKDMIFAEMDAIVNSVSDSCSPRVPVEVNIENVDGKSLIVLDVLAGGRTPYYLKSEGEKDGVYIRVGATTRHADDAAIHELMLLADSRSVDGEPCPGAKIDDRRIAALCSRMYTIARKNCKTDAERKKVKKVTPTQSQDWGVISKVRGKWVASNAYALLTGDKAFATRAKWGVFKGSTKAIFVDRRDFTGGISELIEESYNYLLAKINMGCVFNGVYRQDVYELPPEALRELVINAYAHRNYFDHNAPVFFAVYDDRVEIVSPGGLPRGLSVEEVLSGHSKIRNRVLAAALNYMHYIEEWGSGMLRVQNDLREYSHPGLEIEDTGVDFTFRVRRLVEKVRIDPKKLDIGLEKLDIDPEKLDIEAFPKPTQVNIKKLMASLTSVPYFKRSDAVKILNLTGTAVSNLIVQMLNAKIIESISGHGKGAYRFAGKLHFRINSNTPTS